MKIKKQKGNILISTDGKEVFIMSRFEPSSSDKQLVVNTTDHTMSSSHVVETPGEYEISDILVNVYGYGGNLDKPAIVSIDSGENIKLLYLSREVDSMEKSVIDRLPDINILMIELTKENISKKLQIVSDIEPDIFIPLSDKSVETDLAKELGVKDVVEVGTVSISQKDFTEESSDLLVYFLT